VIQRARAAISLSSCSVLLIMHSTTACRACILAHFAVLFVPATASSAETAIIDERIQS